MLQMYDRVLVSGHIETLVMLTLIAAVALLVLGLLDALRSIIAIRISCWLNDRLGPVYLAAALRAKLQGDPGGGQALRDLAQVQAFVSSPGLTVFFDAPWTPIFLFIIWVLHPTLGLVALASAVILLALGLLNELVTRKHTSAATAFQIAASAHAEATIRNAEVVQAMGMSHAVAERWQALNQRSLAAMQRASERGGVIVGLTKFVRMFVQTAILGAGAYLVIKSDLTAGAMIATSILLGRALAPVELAMSTWRSFGVTRLAYSRLQNRLQTFPREAERARLPTPLGRIDVEGITYALQTGRRDTILENVSFSLLPGQAMAVIGPSASGKSTLCRLLVGIGRAAQGEIRLDGSEIGHFNAEDLGRSIGYLPQDVELFGGSVRENIARMGEIDDEAVIEAAMLAHAHEMIQKLPQGYDTQIGDAGTRLSAGQRQRIGLARAIYGGPRILVLDEPNANLDQAGEAALAAAVQELKEKGASLVIVGHRPSTLAQVDKILLLKDGRVQIFGPRDEVAGRLRLAATGSPQPRAASPRPRAADGPASNDQIDSVPGADLPRVSLGVVEPSPISDRTQVHAHAS
jgi:PrtD family type I secretion system ABC transporter